MSTILRGSKRRRRIIGLTITYILLAIGAVIFLLPLFWMVSTSLKSDAEVYAFPPQWIPKRIVIENYVNAWNLLPVGRFIRNTLQLAIFIVIGNVISSSIVAYGFARLRFRGSQALFFLLLATMMLPGQVTMIPLFMLFSKLDWVNTYLPLIVPAYFGSPYLIFLLRQFMTTIPSEMDEAARIDGCGWFGIFFRIILPLSKPALGVVAITSFNWAWNEFMGPLIYIHDLEKFPISMGLQLYQGQFGVAWQELMAVSLIALIPVIITFFIAQKYYIQGIVLTGVKG